jgi:hypothetical protein
MKLLPTHLLAYRQSNKKLALLPCHELIETKTQPMFSFSFSCCHFLFQPLRRRETMTATEGADCPRVAIFLCYYPSRYIFMFAFRRHFSSFCPFQALDPAFLPQICPSVQHLTRISQERSGGHCFVENLSLENSIYASHVAIFLIKLVKSQKTLKQPMRTTCRFSLSFVYYHPLNEYACMQICTTNIGI